MTKIFTLLLGIMILTIGAMGAFSGGHDHDMIGFGVNSTHNVVHLLSGAIGIAAALAGSRASKVFCLIFGVVYGLVVVAGFLDIPAVVSLMNLNRADNYLHLAIATSCLFFGLKPARIG